MPKLGDIDPATGLIFWSKSHNWLTKDLFASYMASKNRAAEKFRLKHPDYKKQQEKKHHDKNVKRRRDYYLNNKDAVIARSTEWGLKNKERKLQICRKSYSKRLKTNPLFRLRCLIGNRVKCAFRRKNIEMDGSIIPLVGCTILELRKHIEDKFRPGMSWENWGPKTWHVDHIKPMATATCKEELEKLCHYTNLQPLFATENLKKSDKWLSLKR